MAFGRVLSGSRYFVLVWTLILTFRPSDYYHDVHYIGPALVTVLDMFRSSFIRFVTFSSIRRPSGSKKHFLKVNSSLQLMNATFVAIFLILLEGDISRNPGPIPTNISEGTQVENIPLLISNRRNYSRFKQPSKRNVMVQRNYSNNNLIYVPFQTLESSNRFSQNKVIVGQSHCIKFFPFECAFFEKSRTFSSSC